MSNSIDTRSSFFPRSNSATSKAPVEQARPNGVGGMPDPMSPQKGDLAARTAGDARVSIPDGVRDFSRIKKTADAAPEVDNTDKIARLKAQIQAGTYDVDYDSVADKMLQNEF